MQTAQRDVNPFAAIKIGERIGAVSRGDIDLYYHQIRGIIQIDPVYMLIFYGGIIVRVEVCGQSRQAERGGRVNTLSGGSMDSGPR